MKRLITAATFLAVLVSATPQARAFGLGVYATGGIGNGDITTTDAGSRTHASTLYGGGVLLDTSLARNVALASLPRERLGYRLKLGYQRQNWDDGVDLNAGTVDAILGVKLVSTQTLRFWAGPVIRAEYVWGTEEVTTPYYGFAGEHVMKSTLSAWGGGIGAALGMNVVSLGLGVEVGYVYNWLFGSANGAEGAERSFDGTEGHFYGSVAVMFR